MILFCEECGQRNSITLTPSLIESNSFTCQFCGFHSPFPFLDQERQSTGSNPGITWEPDVLQLDPELINQEQRFQLTFKVQDIPSPELTVEPCQDFIDLITVEKTTNTLFTIIIKSLTERSPLPPGYNDIGLIYCEEHFMSWGTINILYKEQQKDTLSEQSSANIDKEQETPPPTTGPRCCSCW